MPRFSVGPDSILEALFRLVNEDQGWRFTRKGDKRPLCDIAASLEGKRRVREAKQKAAMERVMAEVRARNLCRPEPGQSITDRMLRAMKPGEWYGMGDIARMAGATRSERGKVHQVLLRRGWVEKATNSAYRGILNPQEIAAGAEPEPLHLFRLTEQGLEAKSKLPPLAPSTGQPARRAG